MEACYVTERQCAGQDKRDIVACEAAYWVQVVKDRSQCEREGKVQADGTYIFTKCSKIKKRLTNYHVIKCS